MNWFDFGAFLLEHSISVTVKRFHTCVCAVALAGARLHGAHLFCTRWPCDVASSMLFVAAFLWTNSILPLLWCGPPYWYWRPGSPAKRRSTPVPVWNDVVFGRSVSRYPRAILPSERSADSPIVIFQFVYCLLGPQPPVFPFWLLWASYYWFRDWVQVIVLVLFIYS